MNVIVQADHIIPEEMAKIQNQVESRTVKTEMITNETTYLITSKISTTVVFIPGFWVQAYLLPGTGRIHLAFCKTTPSATGIR